MKIAVLADVHANYLALQAVVADVDAWMPDRVIVAGDLVNRGPRSRECLRLVQERCQRDGWQVLLGNHEEYVLTHAAPDAPRDGAAFEVHRPSYWAYCRLQDSLDFLQRMPFSLSLTGPDGREARFAHASMAGTREGIFPGMAEESLRRRIAPLPGLFCAGHTHIPLLRQLDGTLVVNAGSAGLPFDGDPRPAYARLTWQKGRWQGEIRRVAYDREQAEQDFYRTGYLEGAGPLIKIVLLELQQARSHLYQWAAEYQERVLVGEITMEQAVADYLSKVGAG